MGFSDDTEPQAEGGVQCRHMGFSDDTEPQAEGGVQCRYFVSSTKLLATGNLARDDLIKVVSVYWWYLYLVLPIPIRYRYHWYRYRSTFNIITHKIK